VNLTVNQSCEACEDLPATVIMQDNCGNELAFMGMVFPDIAQMLNDPNVWIRYISDTVNTTPHKIK